MPVGVSRAVLLAAPLTGALLLSATAHAVEPNQGSAAGLGATPPTTREIIVSESERIGASMDANTLFGKLVHRYRGMSFYQDSVKLAHRTVAPSSGIKDDPTEPIRSEQLIDCVVDGSYLDVVSSALGGGASCDARDVSPIGRLAMARQLWTLPHLALRFADEPLRSMHGGGDCGSLVPTRVEEVTIDAKQLLRLHLESEHSNTTDPLARCEQATLDLYVNPASMLIERIEHSHGLGEGLRYEATLEIRPSRAVEEKPAAAPPAATTPEPAAPTGPRGPTIDPAPAPASSPVSNPVSSPASSGTKPAPTQPELPSSKRGPTVTID